jgi:hypothetical protein
VNGVDIKQKEDADRDKKFRLFYQCQTKGSPAESSSDAECFGPSGPRHLVGDPRAQKVRSTARGQNRVNPPIKNKVTARRKLSKKCSGRFARLGQMDASQQDRGGGGQTQLERMPADDKRCHTISNQAAEGTVTLD